MAGDGDAHAEPTGCVGKSVLGGRGGRFFEGLGGTDSRLTRIVSCAAERSDGPLVLEKKDKSSAENGGKGTCVDEVYDLSRFRFSLLEWPALPAPEETLSPRVA